MKKIKSIIVLAGLGLLTACSDTVYDCDNGAVKEEALRIQKEHFVNVIGAHRIQPLSVLKGHLSMMGGVILDEDYKNINYSLENIRTSQQDVELGNYHCKANMVTRKNGKEQKVEIFYSVEATADDNAYVETNLLNDREAFELVKVLILPK